MEQEKSMGLLRSVASWLRSHPRLGAAALMLLPDFRFITTIAPIGPMRIRLRRNRSYWLRDPLTHERFALSALRCFIRPGCVVYDVGANLGLYTRFACHFGADKVVAFEPMTENRQELVHNIKLGGIDDRVTVLPFAVSSVNEHQDFQIDDMSSASGTLSVVTGGAASQGRSSFGFRAKTERVTCRTLDSLLENDDLPPPDVIKIDIEGAEALLLAGATRLLRSCSPRLIIELHGPDKARDVLTLLCKLNYVSRGLVSKKLDPRGYGPLGLDCLAAITDLYDVHYLISAKDCAYLPSEMPDYSFEADSVPTGDQ